MTASLRIDHPQQPAARSTHASTHDANLAAHVLHNYLKWWAVKDSNLGPAD
jgi:hypothetical protein